jgi:nitrogen-specific signal transduction histidine kinase
MSINEPHTILYLNPAMKKTLEKCYPGIREEEFNNSVQGLEVKIVKVDSNEEPVKELLINVISSKKKKVKRKYYLDNLKDNTEITISKVIFERSKAILVMFTDCSSGKTMDELRQENRNKTCLIYTISHELRTPVSGIMGTLELISKQVSSESADLIARAKECCNIIESHINDFTVFSYVHF